MNDRHAEADDRRAVIEEEAVGWFVRMRGEDADRLHAEFEAWVNASPEHRKAYDWAERHFSASEILKTPAPSKIRQTKRHWGWLAAGTAVAAAVLLAINLNPSFRAPIANNGPAGIEPGSSLSTAHGEIRIFRLTDGSSVTLDSDSRIEVAMNDTERRLRLLGGKVRVEVARGRRPFVVEAGAGAVETEEASFDIGFNQPNRILVSLVSGRAAIRGLVQPAAYYRVSQPLMMGRPMAYSAGSFHPSPFAGHIADDRDWPSGWVEYREISLGALVAEANRYAAHPVRLDDPETGALKVSGRFKLTDTETFVSRTAELFDLAVSRRYDGIHLTQQ
ncbi:MAG TPA: FecR domain-containing protein [Novosphingobium sp.]|nr:FecR domain-containing protein [Novosphingobium sp.]